MGAFPPLPDTKVSSVGTFDPDDFPNTERGERAPKGFLTRGFSRGVDEAQQRSKRIRESGLASLGSVEPKRAQLNSTPTFFAKGGDNTFFLDTEENRVVTGAFQQQQARPSLLSANRQQGDSVARNRVKQQIESDRLKPISRDLLVDAADARRSSSPKGEAVVPADFLLQNVQAEKRPQRRAATPPAEASGDTRRPDTATDSRRPNTGGSSGGASEATGRVSRAARTSGRGGILSGDAGNEKLGTQDTL
jgi:hypothetical protein